MRRSVRVNVPLHLPLRAITASVSHARPEEPVPAEPEPVEVPEEPPDDVQQDHQELLTMLRQLETKLDAVRTENREQLGDLQELAVELAVAVAAHVIKQKVDRDELALTELVHDAIQHMGLDHPLQVKVNSKDRSTLDTFEGTAFPGPLELTSDDDVPRGACLVISGRGGVMSSLEGRLENVRETLLQGIAYARNERPQAVDVGGAVQRLSDYRKPA